MAESKTDTELEENKKSTEDTNFIQTTDHEEQVNADKEDLSCLEKHLPLNLRLKLSGLTFVLGILWGFFADTFLAIYDVISDYILAAEHFQNQDIIWGSLTIALTLVPTILGFITASDPSCTRRCKEFLLHLPGIQVWKHLLFQRQIVSHLDKANECEKKTIIAKADKDSQQVKHWSQLKEKNERHAHKVQGQLNEFKTKEAFGESYPQVILQLAIVVKNGISTLEPSFNVIQAIVSSIATLVLTITSLTVSLPFYIDETRRVQLKDWKLQYLIVLPLTFFAVLPRLITLVMFFSVFDMTNAWIPFAILVPLVIVYIITYWAILFFYVRPRMKQDLKEKLKDRYEIMKVETNRFLSLIKPLRGLCEKEERSSLNLGYMTNLLAPVNIFNPHWSFYHFVNILSTLLYLILVSLMMLLTSFTNALKLPEDISKEVYLTINGILFGSLLLSAGIFYGIFYLIKRQNLSRLFLWSLQGRSENEDIAVQLLENYNFDLNVRSIKGLSALDLVCMNGFVRVLSKLVKEPKGLDFNETDTNGYSAFHMACKKDNLEVIKLLVENSITCNINLNANAVQPNNQVTDLGGSTGFIIACLRKHTEVIEYMKANAEKYNVDLDLKNDNNKTGFDILANGHQ